MVKRNENLAKLKGGYLFPEINRRKQAFLEKNPDAKIISLGVGDTTEPLSKTITEALSSFANGLGTKTGYSGYGFEQGHFEIREKIAQKIYGGLVSPDVVFISDGAKCDIGRMQTLFGKDVTIAVQDPSYPAYIDTSVIMGQTHEFDDILNQYKGITYLACNPENNFFPDLTTANTTDLIYFCSPNNPTGVAATKNELSKLVAFAKKNRSIIVFDAAYALYIQDPALPKSIYEIHGAKEVAIEIGSFSKIAGFTGVRLGWCVIPEELKFDDGTSVKNDWNRLISTFFNGASNIAIAGGMGALSDEGIQEMHATMGYYLENARLIRETLLSLDIQTYGKDSPYIWAQFPRQNSWEVFEHLLENAHIICTPGSGFGPAGEGFIRFSAYGHRENITEACSRLHKLYSKVNINS
jgi:LL-diaminopimelate aminotransferase